MTEREFEMMDDYLSNRLSAEDQAAFEKQVQADPQLAQELDIQKSLVEGIKQARAVELKSMLNQIPVAPVSGGSSVLVKVGTWAVVAGLIATGIYFYSTQDEEARTVARNSVPEQQPETKPEVAETPESDAVTEQETDKKEEVAKPVEKKKKQQASEPETSTSTPAKPNAFDATQEETSDAVKRYESEQLENLKKAFVTSSIEVETDTMHKKYNFHYVFKDSKLILYGAFEKNLYEILEFIGDEKRTVVLFYKNSYYLLDIDKTQPTKLSPIRDRRLLKKLQEHRSK